MKNCTIPHLTIVALLACLIGVVSHDSNIVAIEIIVYSLMCKIIIDSWVDCAKNVDTKIIYGLGIFISGMMLISVSTKGQEFATIVVFLCTELIYDKFKFMFFRKS